MKNIIINSLQDSLKSIYKNKTIFFFLFLMQIIFIATFVMINLPQLTKVLENAKELQDYLESQEFSDIGMAQDILQAQSILGDDPLFLSKKFKEMIKNFQIYLVTTLLMIIIIGTFMWTLTLKLSNNKIKKLIKIAIKNSIILLFYFGLIFIFLFSMLNVSLLDPDTGEATARIIPFLIFSIVMVYFMFISISIKETKFKELVEKTLTIGIKKFHYIISTYFISAVLFFISLFLIIYFVEKNAFLMTISIILMIFTILFARLFMIKVVERIE